MLQICDASGYLAWSDIHSRAPENNIIIDRKSKVAFLLHIHKAPSCLFEWQIYGGGALRADQAANLK